MNGTAQRALAFLREDCIACGWCQEACPVSVISRGESYAIDGSHCLECGRSLEVCPTDAIEPAAG